MEFSQGGNFIFLDMFTIGINLYFLYKYMISFLILSFSHFHISSLEMSGSILITFIVLHKLLSDPPPTYPTFCSFNKQATKQAQNPSTIIVPPVCAWIGRCPLECGSPIREDTFKKNSSPFLSLTIANSFLCKSETSSQPPLSMLGHCLD